MFQEDDTATHLPPHWGMCLAVWVGAGGSGGHTGSTILEPVQDLCLVSSGGLQTTQQFPPVCWPPASPQDSRATSSFRIALSFLSGTLATSLSLLTYKMRILLSTPYDNSQLRFVFFLEITCQALKVPGTLADPQQIIIIINL